MVKVELPFDKEDIDEVFPLIAPYLENIEKEYNGDKVDEVYRMLVDGVATLHFCGSNMFLVLQWMPNECFIRIAGSFTRDKVDLGAVFEGVKHMARLCGCKRISFTSSRKGMAKTAEKLGCSPVAVTYGTEV